MTDQAATLSEHERWLVRHCGPLQGDYQDLYARVSAFIHANDRYPSTTDRAAASSTRTSTPSACSRAASIR
jgi:hypothetical protein